MVFTIKDAMSMDNFKKLRIVAGANGIDRQITKVGILDYEYVKQTESSYVKGEFVLTSFLYAKNDESIILDAVKNLIAANVSGLAVKNVFYDSLPKDVIDYANKKAFPIFILDIPVYFEDLIVEIYDRIRTYSDYSRYESIIDSILKDQLSRRQLEELAKEIHPSVKDNLITIYIQPSDDKYIDYYRQINFFEKKLDKDSHVIKYGNGFLFLISWESPPALPVAHIVKKLFLKINISPDEYITGVSSIHRSLEEFDACIHESLRARKICTIKQENTVYYENIGIYKILFSCLEDDNTLKFSENIISALSDYDADSTSNLLNTAIIYVNCDGSVKKTAEKLSQHENTIRYRINKIKSIISSPSASDYILSAVKIHMLRSL